MAHIYVEGSDLVIRLTGLDRLFALEGSLTVPLANVRGATADPGIIKEPRGIRAPGTNIPRVVTAGTFHRDGERVFWAVRDPNKAVVIELADHHYARLVVQVPDPRAAVALVEHATPR
ncbi:hypothetical protein KO481_02845 [Nocardia sp. NEAU-G5]|uniref:Bacterial Pleckstrin homology domain-containing protein n=1 Tax=Nocardia albiluteola TaxID=2842303 RepID=A0ABS6AU35_9NOCA|nr:hypothetical protein [Nocardia albiluteola]MBU3060460.1 hypothetical protein [Nocardia albiluteola]